MTFTEWFETHYREPGEPLMRAAARIQIDTHLSYATFLRMRRGQPVTRATAAKMVELSDGLVDPLSLLLGNDMPVGAE